MTPALKREGGSVVTSTIVDPSPPGVRPPSMTASTLSLNASAMSSAKEHSFSPERFALVAVTGRESITDSRDAMG